MQPVPESACNFKVGLETNCKKRWEDESLVLQSLTGDPLDLKPFLGKGFMLKLNVKG
jgi:hypothetical protein